MPLTIGDLTSRFDPSKRDVGAQFDIWLTLLALIACMETFGVCCLATWRFARKVYNVRLQRWTMRIMLIGPVYSWLMWVSLWTPSLDYFIAIPVGFYEAYAFYCFYALLVCFADGEDRVIMALSSLPGPPTAYVYYPFFGETVNCGAHYTPLFGGRVQYAKLARFGTSRELLGFLRRGVTQAMIIKPLAVVVMLLMNLYGYINYANYARIFSIVSLWLVANSLTQLYHVILPRIRGLGGEKLFVVLLLMIVVLIIQDTVVSALLINSGTSSATSELPTRLIFILTILEFTAFATIFYRLLPPEKFAQIAWTNSNANLTNLAPPPPLAMSVKDFIWVIVDPRTMFSIPRGRVQREPSFSMIAGDNNNNNNNGRCHAPDPDIFGVKETKLDRGDDDDDAAGLFYDEHSPLIKN